MPTDYKTYNENSTSQMRKGVLELGVLLILAGSELYASDIINKLAEYDLLMVEGTLYPLLSRLKEAELVSYTWVESKEGPPRKYYKLTEKGKQALDHQIKHWKSLNQSINSLRKNYE
jgi:PadR family transcriptional regulator, regulatory protein PadR